MWGIIGLIGYHSFLFDCLFGNLKFEKPLCYVSVKTNIWFWTNDFEPMILNFLALKNS